MHLQLALHGASAHFLLCLEHCTQVAGSAFEPHRGVGQFEASVAQPVGEDGEGGAAVGTAVDAALDDEGADKVEVEAQKRSHFVGAEHGGLHVPHGGEGLCAMAQGERGQGALQQGAQGASGRRHREGACEVGAQKVTAHLHGVATRGSSGLARGGELLEAVVVARGEIFQQHVAQRKAALWYAAAPGGGVQVQLAMHGGRPETAEPQPQGIGGEAGNGCIDREARGTLALHAAVG